jgi:phosphatidylglycerophosphate synthase
MDGALNKIGTIVRGWMIFPARIIATVSNGHITPNHITLVSFFGHFLVVWALIESRPVVAAVLLAFFGIMDSLDGALARLQKKSSVRGMFYDATSDRAKEVLVYCGIAIFLETVGLYGYDVTLASSFPIYVYFWVPVAVLGLSQLVSYIKAKGEMALSSSGYDAQKLNRIFTDGLARYEVRMFVVIVGLLSGKLLTALCLLLLLLVFTCVQRFKKVSQALRNV